MTLSLHVAAIAALSMLGVITVSVVWLVIAFGKFARGIEANRAANNRIVDSFLAHAQTSQPNGHEQRETA